MFWARPSQPSYVYFQALCMFLSLALSPSTVCGQLNRSLAARDPGASQARFVVTGTVVNSITSEPIPRALVSIGYPQRFVLTGVDGTFRFDQVTEGLVNVMAQKPGFFSEEQVQRRQYKLTKVGPDMEPLVLKLTPEGMFTGRVEDAGGEPIEGATVQITFVHIINGRRQNEKRGGSSTDEDGEFRIPNLLPGTYYLSVQANYQRSYEPGEDRNSKKGYPLILHWPGVRDLADATPLQLGPGQRMRMNFSLTPERVFTVSGSVVGHVPGLYVHLELASVSGDSLPANLRCDPRTGKFEGRGLPAGNYILKVVQGNPAGPALASELPLNLTSNRDGLIVQLQTQRSIPVIIHAESIRTSSLPSPQFSPSQMVSIHLFSDQPGIPELWSTLDNSSGEPRRLSLQNVKPARYLVDLSSNGSWYVQSAVYGNTDVLKEGLLGGSQPPETPLEIYLGDDAATLGVSVNSDSDALVVIAPDFAPMLAPRALFANSRGQSQISGLAPGEYTVLAFARSDGIEYANPEVLSKYLSKGTRVTLSTNRKSSVTADLIQVGD